MRIYLTLAVVLFAAGTMVSLAQQPLPLTACEQQMPAMEAAVRSLQSHRDALAMEIRRLRAELEALKR